MNTFSAAGQALGFGRTGVAPVGVGNTGGLGGQLGQEVADEVDEEKLRKRLGLSVTQQGGSPAMQSLLGGVFR